MNKQSLEQWISQLDKEGYCDISDKQVEALIRGFAALEEQRDALAAENAALKSNADKARQVIMSSKFDYWSDRGELLEAVRLIGETPATDAYLREVRAQGVEMMAEQCEVDIAFIEPEDEEHYTLMIEHAREFAAKLRKGGAA